MQEVISIVFKKILNDSMIGIYDNSLSKKECERVVQIFENSESKTPGKLLFNNESVVNTSAKSDIELMGTRFNDGTEISQIIFNGVSKSFKKYREKYKLGLDSLCKWELVQTYNVQKYDGEQDGYFAWHCETGGGELQGRIIAWMIYLNDAKCGTDFLYYPSVRSKRGRCVIWPAGWTHTHRAVLPNRGLKYFATGWFHFE